MAKSNLLKEAIADAKAVRETAIANAKLALEEAFTPKLQSMLSRKIEEETEEDEDTVDEITGSSTIGNGDNKVDIADGDDEEKPETTKQSAAYGSEDSNNTVVDKLTENEEDEEEVTEGEYGEDEEETTEMHETEDDEMDLDLEAIIRELEGEDEEETTEIAYEEEEDLPVDEMGMSNETEEETVDEAEDEEEVDLDEIIKSLHEEDDDEEEVNEAEDEEETTKVDELSERLKEAYTTIKTMKSTINEVNLLNAKLLFSNKLFKSHNLTEGQKMKIIETFDRAVSTREVKLVYSTLAESLSSNASKKSTIKESFASKATRSTKPAPKAVIVEADQFTNRMKKLAGLL